jgi:Xaa-Pro aminopeptidase
MRKHSHDNGPSKHAFAVCGIDHTFAPIEAVAGEWPRRRVAVQRPGEGRHRYRRMHRGKRRGNPMAAARESRRPARRRAPAGGRARHLFTSPAGGVLCPRERDRVAPALPFDAERLARLAREQHVDVVLASSRHNVRYLTGGYYLHFFARAPRFGGGQYLSFVAVPAARPETGFYVGRRDQILDEQHYIDAFGPFWIAERHWVPRGPNMSEDAAAVAARALRAGGHGEATIAIESSFLPADAYDALRRELPQATFVNAAPLLGELRAIKQSRELDRLREVHRLTAEVIRTTFHGSSAADTTQEMSDAIRRRIGARGAGFLYSLINVGPGLLRAPSSERWGRGRPMHLDVGAELDEYVADVARMGSVGAPPKEAAALFEICVAAQARVREAVGPGVPAGEVWRIGTEAVRTGPAREHGRLLVHGLGMVSHEPPVVAEGGTRPLETGMVLSIETEVRHPDVGHIKLEDSVVVTERGCEGLGDVGRDWCIAANV